MAEPALTEAIRKARTAAALDDDDDTSDSAEEDADSTDDAETSESDTPESEVDAQPKPETAAEEPAAAAPETSGNLGYTFVPLGGQKAAPVDTGAKASQFFLNPATGSYEEKQYPDEQGGSYVIDQDTGKMVPRAQLATEADKAAQPPGGIILPRETVTGQAPDQLTQVERAQPAGEPAPDKLTQVERAQPVEAPGQAGQVERGALVSTPPGTAPKALPVPGQNYIFKPLAAPAAPAQPTTAPVQPPKAPDTPSQQPTLPQNNPDGSVIPERIQAVGNQDPVAFITHHTSGRGTVEGVINTLHERGLGVEYVMDRDGNIYDAGFGSGASNILPGWGPKGEGLNNRNIVGMEVIAKDNSDVTQAQKDSFARFMALRYPNTPIFGHGEVNPGHKEADEGQATKNAAMAYRARFAGGNVQDETATSAPQAQPGTKGDNGLYPNEKREDFLTGKATTFATPEDVATYNKTYGAEGDNGVGAPRLGKLDTTSVIGVAIPEEALRAKYGNNYAAWRTARADVVDQETGKRMRAPIADLGPRGDLSAIFDMTPGLSKYFGGDKNLSIKLVDNAGPDAIKNPQLFADEQAALKEGFDSSVVGRAKVQPKQPYTFKPLSAAEAARAQTQAEQSTITNLPESGSGNIIGLYKRLNQPVNGVSDTTRTAVQNELKPQIIASMRAKFPELKSDDEAWAKANSDVGLSDVGQDFWNKIWGNFESYTNVIKKTAIGSTQVNINRFLSEALPNGTDADRHALMTKLYALPPDQREQAIAQAVPSTSVSDDPEHSAAYLSHAMDVLLDPNIQQKQAAELKDFQAKVTRNLASDPRLKGTGIEPWVDNIAQIPAMAMAYSNPAFYPMAMAKIADETKAQMKAEHPDWSSDKLQTESTYAGVAAFFGPVVAGHIIGHFVEPLIAPIEGAVQRALAKVGIGGAGGAVVGGGTQALTNVVTGQPAGQGVGQAAMAGAIQGGVTGLAPGVGERPAERTEIAPPEARPEPPPPEAKPRPVTAGDVLGPDVSAKPWYEGAPWYEPGPVVTRATERTAFGPQELEEAIRQARASGSPQTIQEAIASLRPEPDFTQQTVHLAQEPVEAALAEARTVAREVPPEEPVVGNNAPVHPSMGEDPWVSTIANRFVQDRIDKGEIGEVVPGKGVSTQELVAKGLAMSPEQVTQAMSDLMHNTGNPIDQAAAIRAEEARLSSRSQAASVFAENNPGNAQAKIDADNAFKDLTDFHNGPVAALKKNWHAQGMSMQGEIPVDLSTFNGIREQWLRDQGKAPSPQMERTLRKTADQVRRASADEANTMRKLAKEIDKQQSIKMPSEDELATRIAQRMGQMPCIPI